MWCASVVTCIELRNIHQRVVLSSESCITFIRRIGAERGMMRVMYSGTGYNHRHRVSRFHQSVVYHSESCTSNRRIWGLERVSACNIHGSVDVHQHRKLSKLHQSVVVHTKSVASEVGWKG